MGELFFSQDFRVFSLPKWVPKTGDNIWALSQKCLAFFHSWGTDNHRLCFREFGSRALLWSTHILHPQSRWNWKRFRMSNLWKDGFNFWVRSSSPSLCSVQWRARPWAVAMTHSALWFASADKWPASVWVRGLLLSRQPYRGICFQMMPVTSQDQQLLTQMPTGTKWH